MSIKQVSRFEEVLEESTLAISTSVEQDDHSCKLDVYSFIDNDQISAVVYSCEGKELIRVYIHGYSGAIVIENLDKDESIEIKLREIPEYPLASTRYFARLAQPRSIAELEALVKDYITDIVSAYLDVIARP